MNAVRSIFSHTFHNRKSGFTLIELLVVIAVIGILASVILASLNSARGKARDARRLSDMKQIQTALELYYDTYGVYPSSDQQGCGGWDTPGDGDFITPLTTAGFMPSDVKDPQTNAACGNYRYYRYDAGYAGCPANRGYFYVLQIVDMESQGMPAKGSPGWACGSLNWNLDAEWATGKFEQ